ncbi:MAG TPA: hypothetical protein VG057_22210 [Solirubrobacteraceae bacterium]|nr:hypothetical protein [Solirubrobacteraceae bacterium]
MTQPGTMVRMDVDELYGLPFDEFVPARNALARELRKAGKRDEAAEVSALRKPSVAAWAVDQLVRTQRKAISELFDAGDALRAAQEDVLAGRGDGQSLRAAVDRERTAVDALAGAARGLLSSDGHELSPTIVERVSDTLHAAALDDEAREQVREGRLERELRHVGLGVLGAPPAGARPAGAPAPPRKKKPATANKRPAADRAAERAAREERERAQRERAEARAAAREARRRAEHAERAHRVAAERRDRAAEALREAESQLNVAETELAEAQEALRAAEAAAG